MTDYFQSETFQSLLVRLKELACPDDSTEWPEQQLDAMAEAGVTRWDIPAEFDGLDFGPADMLEGLMQLASACLVSTFVLTQRSAAVRRIATSTNRALRAELLPQLRDGTIFATVGISHLTTSGQHLQQPLVQATETEGGFLLNGTVPWATGATRADYLVTGGTLEDGRQILAAVPTWQVGIDVQPAVQLMALNASQTGAVRLEEMQIESGSVLHGPVEKVMQQGTGGGAGSLGTSALAIGAATGSLQSLAEEAVGRPELREFVEPLQQERDQIAAQLRLAAAGRHPGGDAALEQIRQQANSLVLRTAQAWLAATKGAGFVSGHPAERAVRESMFFLVWSCPQPVLAGNLREFACPS